ncbi:hypothetical protein BpHYR1_040704, partial [Brachionus plicatilis]
LKAEILIGLDCLKHLAEQINTHLIINTPALNGINYLLRDVAKCVSYNVYFHQLCCPDGDKEVPAAEKMKRKGMKDRNKLDFQLKKRFWN